MIQSFTVSLRYHDCHLVLKRVDITCARGKHLLTRIQIMTRHYLNQVIHSFQSNSSSFISETYDVTTNYKPVVEMASEEDKENNVTIDISPEKANIGAPESPGLDKTYTMGLGVLNPKKTVSHLLQAVL